MADIADFAGYTPGPGGFYKKSDHSGPYSVDPNGVPVLLGNHATTGVSGGNKTVTTAGTAVTLKATATPAKWVWIHAYTANTGRIAVGGSGVNASTTIGTGTGGSLAAGESVMLPCDDLADIYIDATVNGEGVRYTYGT